MGGGPARKASEGEGQLRQATERMGDGEGASGKRPKSQRMGVRRMSKRRKARGKERHSEQANSASGIRRGQVRDWVRDDKRSTPCSSILGTMRMPLHGGTSIWEYPYIGVRLCSGYPYVGITLYRGTPYIDVPLCGSILYGTSLYSGTRYIGVPLYKGTPHIRRQMPSRR